MPAPAPRYAVGIDLGTTHTVVAYAEASAAKTGDPGDPIRPFAIDQQVGPGEVAGRPLLPSVRYHPAPGELAADATPLPWPAPANDLEEGHPPAVIGTWARQLGAQVPGRLVASAKSWLSHAGVDRVARILPWGADDGVAKVSPVAASASYLAHVRAAWNARFPETPLEAQDVVLTVPASFDEAARALTVAAARDAGLPRLALLEEPQAAFHDWLWRHRATLGAALSGARLVLVCDVGGGTTDLSLIRVDPGHPDDGADAAPRFARVGVGDHLMLGGDNMDLALARLVEQRLGAGPLGASRLAQLIARCRVAKETLLADGAPGRTTVTLLGAGSRLVGGAASVEVTKDEVERLVVDGFFPRVGPDETARRSRGAIVEFGLPYAADPAVTRHVATFLQRHAETSRDALGAADAGTGSVPVPDALLLNGGVFRADALADRLAATLADWRGAPVARLDHPDPDLAVARGAVAHALARRGAAPRIGGGSPRSYFLVLGDAPDDAPTRRAVCLLPRGSEPGRELTLEGRTFALRLGRPVRFHLVSSTADDGPPPRAGDLVDLRRGDHASLPPVATVLDAAGVGGAGGRRETAVRLVTALSEVGTLDLHCVAADDPERRWKLEFQLRGGDAAAAAGDAAAPRVAAAVEAIDRVYGARSQAVAPKEVRQLRQALEHGLGPRERWATPLLRQLHDALWQRARNRRRSADHERMWLNLAGYCLRPGFGDPLDGWRLGELWTIFESGVQHGYDAQVGAEWWTLWRRVAAGLPDAAQLRLLDDFAFNLQGAQAGLKRPPKLVKGGDDEMVRLGASLERIPAEHKVEVGDWLLERIRNAVAAPKPGDAVDRDLWALGRIGAREPFHGSAHAVVPPDAAARWLDAVLDLDWKRAPGAAFAAAQLARRTGDRARDVSDALRGTVAERLAAARAPAAWIAMVREVVRLDAADERQVYGEALPPGLKLIG